MKKLSDMIAEVKRAKIEGGDPDRIAGPMFDAVCEFSFTHSNLIDKFRHQKGEDADVPQEVMNLIFAAYSWGATSALSTLQRGLVIRDKDGKAVDRAYYSLDELLSEAESISDPDFQLQNLEHEMEIMQMIDDQLEEDEAVEEEPESIADLIFKEEVDSTVAAQIVAVKSKHLH